MTNKVKFSAAALFSAAVLGGAFFVTNNTVHAADTPGGATAAQPATESGEAVVKFTKTSASPVLDPGTGDSIPGDSNGTGEIGPLTLDAIPKVFDFGSQEVTSAAQTIELLDGATSRTVNANPSKVQATNADGSLKYTETQVQQKDANGDPVVDGNGDPVYDTIKTPVMEDVAETGARQATSETHSYTRDGNQVVFTQVTDADKTNPTWTLGLDVSKFSDGTNDTLDGATISFDNGVAQIPNPDETAAATTPYVSSAATTMLSSFSVKAGDTTPTNYVTASTEKGISQQVWNTKDIHLNVPAGQSSEGVSTAIMNWTLAVVPGN